LAVKIAQIAPLFESVPPKLYGGTERVVSYLTEELVREGHQVTLFASGDSITAARLVRVCPRALRLDSGCADPLAHHVLMLDEILRRAKDFDILHFHIDYIHYPLVRALNVPNITTLHGRLDLPDLAPVYRRFSEMPLVSISDSQRTPLSWANWIATVYHGLPLELYELNDGPGRYLAFIGRVSPEKGVDRTIEIARRSGMPLRIAAKVDRADEAYFQSVIRPLLDPGYVEFVGEIGEREKGDFLGNAYALLFPIDWPEPFGLAMIEAMACGTPVIACNRGSVPEVVDEGITGFVVEDVEGAVRAVDRISSINRRLCRRRFEERFSGRRMARDYVSVYRSIGERATADLLTAV
jgi:glycosyltransferase involved in cell wall biosynthesis